MGEDYLNKLLEAKHKIELSPREKKLEKLAKLAHTWVSLQEELDKNPSKEVKLDIEKQQKVTLDKIKSSDINLADISGNEFKIMFGAYDKLCKDENKGNGPNSRYRKKECFAKIGSDKNSKIKNIKNFFSNSDRIELDKADKKFHSEKTYFSKIQDIFSNLYQAAKNKLTINSSTRSNNSTTDVPPTLTTKKQIAPQQTSVIITQTPLKPPVERKVKTTFNQLQAQQAESEEGTGQQQETPSVSRLREALEREAKRRAAIEREALEREAKRRAAIEREALEREALEREASKETQGTTEDKDSLLALTKEVEEMLLKAKQGAQRDRDREPVTRNFSPQKVEPVAEPVVKPILKPSGAYKRKQGNGKKSITFMDTEEPRVNQKPTNTGNSNASQTITGSQKKLRAMESERNNALWDKLYYGAVKKELLQFATNNTREGDSRRVDLKLRDPRSNQVKTVPALFTRKNGEPTFNIAGQRKTTNGGLTLREVENRFDQAVKSCSTAEQRITNLEIAQQRVALTEINRNRQPTSFQRETLPPKNEQPTQNTRPTTQRRQTGITPPRQMNRDGGRTTMCR